MRFFLDHDVPADLARVLRSEGHEVVTLPEALPDVATDEEVFAHACREGLVTVTCNRDDFLTLAAAQEHPGLIILIRRSTRQSECGHFLALLDQAGEDGLKGNINFA
jgi:predicted nuclease of predicted toxin-antitoxin system